MESAWNIIQSILSEPLSHPQTDSYKGCVENTIPRVLRQFNPISLIYKAPLESGEETDVKVDIYVGSVVQDNEIIDNGKGIFFANPTVVRDATKVSPMFPNEARLRNFTYETEISVNVHIRVHDASEEFNTIHRFDTDTTRVSIGRFPIMVRSTLCSLNCISDDPKITGECIQDQGGYYIIDGNEKVVIGQERQVENRPYTRSYLEADNRIVSCECRSVPETKFQPPRTTSVRMLRKDSSIRIIAPGMQESIPFVLLMRALGIPTEARMFDMIAIHLNPSLHEALLDFIRPSFLASRQYKGDSMEMTLLRVWSLIHGTQLEDSDTSISRVRSNDVATVLKENILPHLGYDMAPKAHSIGSMIADMFLLYSKLEKPTDKDSYSNKRIDMGGFLLGKLFRDLYFRVQKRIQEKMNIHVNASEIPKEAILGIRDAFIQKEMVDRTIMDEGFRYAFKSCWGMKNAPCVVGVAQELSRYSYPAYLSHIRRINTPLPASAKMRAPHALHPSTWGYTCPVETPDGRNVGVRKNFSVAARITVGLATPPIEALCGDIGMIPLGRALLHLHSGDSHSGLGTPILINEKMVGYIWNAVEFVTTFRALRRRGVIHPYISISLRNSLTKKSVVISTDDGRPIRPLIVIDPETNKAVAEYPQGRESIAYLCTGRKDVTDIDFFSIERIVDTEHLKQWKENTDAYMESNTGGIIEYIDPQEQDNCLIAMSEEDVTMKDQVVRRFSHSEIHPSLILGILGLNIPFTQTNQAPRNVYSSAQGKQAVGMYATNFNNRMDNKVMVLAYPQKPIVTTHYAPYIRNESMPHGINAVVAIMSYSGYNQEDAVIINQGAVQRGLFNSVTFRSLGIQEDVADQETIGLIPETDMISPKKARRDLLDSRGIVKVGSIIDEDDVLVMKTAPSKYRDPQRRVLLRSDLSLQTKRHESGVVDSVFVDSDRQDGTLVKVRLRKPKTPELGDKFSSRHGQKGTIGMLLPESDMPVNADGIRPDILVNPHAIPSRMTIGQLVEVILGKRGALRGEQYAATAFENGDPRTIAELLQGMGMESYGNEVMYNGRTGEQLRVNIFMGPTFYQRLMHQVADKVNVRTTGPKSALTRQPVGGRGAGGGLRIGEMERDALISHGVASFLKESLMERSDKSSIWIGSKSGMISACNPDKGLYQDFLTEDFSRVRARNEEGELSRGDERVVLSNPRSEFCRLEVPHALKLFIQELEAQGYKIGVITDFILKVWETISPETVSQYQALVQESGASAGVKTSNKIKDLSWIEPLIRWSTAKFGKSLKLGLSAEFMEAFRDIQKKISDISTITNRIELRRLDESAASVAPGELGAIVVSSLTHLESVLDPMAAKADSVLLSSDPFTRSQESIVRRKGWVPMLPSVFQLRGWQCWQKRYRNPPKPMRLLMEQTGLFTTKMEPLYPTILSSEPVAGSVYELARRSVEMGHTTSGVSADSIKKLVRGYLVSTDASSAPIPFSLEHGSDLYRDEFNRESMKLAIIETKRARRGALPLFHTYTRPGYLEITDESRNLIRWVFPMSRLEALEVQSLATLIDECPTKTDTRTSMIVLPERTVSMKDHQEQAVVGTRILAGTRSSPHGCCLPPMNVVNQSMTIRSSELLGEKDPSITNPLVFAGKYPDHIHQSNLSQMRSVVWYWTKVSDVACFKEEPEFDVIFPLYAMGSFLEPSEVTNLLDRMALTELVCEPESLYASLHHSVPVIYCSPYDGWLQVGSFAPPYATWNPTNSALEMPENGSPTYIRVPDTMTPDQWDAFVTWIRDSPSVLQDVQKQAHAWLTVNTRDTLIRSCVKEVQNHVNAIGLAGEVTDWKDILKQESHTVSFEMDIKEEDQEAIGSLLGARGTVANRSHYVTGLQHTVSKDSKRFIVKGDVSTTLQEAGLKTLYGGYLSYRDETYAIGPILEIDAETMRQMDIRTIHMQLARKEVNAGLIPLRIGNGISRRFLMKTQQLRLRGQRRDLELYKQGMNIRDTTTVSEEDMVQIGELAGRKSFIVVVPEYTFDLMDHQGDEEYMDSLVERQVSYIRDKLQQAKEILGASAEFRVVSLSTLYWAPESYPIADAKQRIAISDDQSIQAWNVATMESFLRTDSVKHANWFANTMGDAEYMIWMPPYWKPNVEKDADELQAFLSLFIEPAHDRGKIYLWDPSKVTETAQSVPWMCSLRAPVTSADTTILEDENDWVDALESVWDEENWEAMATTMDMSKKTDRILQPSLSIIQEAYVSNLEQKENGIIHLQVGMRPELLESELWDIKGGDVGEDHWVDLIVANTVLRKEDVTVTNERQNVIIAIQKESLESRYVPLVIAVLLQSVSNAGGSPWQVKNVTEGGYRYELEKGATPMTWDELDFIRLPNGMELPEYAVADVVDILNTLVSDVRIDYESNQVTMKRIEENDTIVVQLNDSDATVLTDVDEFSDISIKHGMTVLYAALTRIAQEPEGGPVAPGTPPMEPMSPTEEPVGGPFAPGTPPMEPMSPTEEPVGDLFAPGTPPMEPMSPTEDLATQTLRTEGGPTMAQRLAMESDDI